MNRDDALILVRSIMFDKLGLEPTEVVPGADLRDDLGMDSLDAIDLIEAVQETIGGRMDTREIENLQTVADVLDAVQELAPIGAAQ